MGSSRRWSGSKRSRSDSSSHSRSRSRRRNSQTDQEREREHAGKRNRGGTVAEAHFPPLLIRAMQIWGGRPVPSGSTQAGPWLDVEDSAPGQEINSSKLAMVVPVSWTTARVSSEVGLTYGAREASSENRAGEIQSTESADVVRLDGWSVRMIQATRREKAAKAIKPATKAGLGA